MAERSPRRTHGTGPAPGKRFPDISNGPGASDGTSGGGAGAGIPDSETLIRTDGAGTRGDVKRDRAKIFPESMPKKPSRGGKAGKRAAGK